MNYIISGIDPFKKKKRLIQSEIKGTAKSITRAQQMLRHSPLDEQ